MATVAEGLGYHLWLQFQWTTWDKVSIVHWSSTSPITYLNIWLIVLFIFSHSTPNGIDFPELLHDVGHTADQHWRYTHDGCTQIWNNGYNGYGNHRSEQLTKLYTSEAWHPGEYPKYRPNKFEIIQNLLVKSFHKHKSKLFQIVLAKSKLSCHGVLLSFDVEFAPFFVG